MRRRSERDFPRMKSARCVSEVRKWTVRIVSEHRGEHDAHGAAIEPIAGKTAAAAVHLSSPS